MKNVSSKVKAVAKSMTDKSAKEFAEKSREDRVLESLKNKRKKKKNK